MSRILILTLAAAATIGVASLASSASFAKGGGGGSHGGGGGHVSGGSHGGGGGHVSTGGRGGNGGHNHVAHNGDRSGHADHRERGDRHDRFAGHDRGRWILRDGRWIVIDPVDADIPDAAPVTDAPLGQCRVSVYWDADFNGERADTSQNQPYVGDHWNDQISSIRVVSGVWQFFWDANYGGEMIELKPGDYARIPAHWNDQISSFRCVGNASTASQ